MDGLAGRPDSLDAIRDRNPVRGGDLLFPRRTAQPVARTVGPLLVKGLYLAVKIHFACPECERPILLERPGPSRWRCPACVHEQPLDTEPPAACTICGNTEFYKKKDFPHWLGLTILTVACLAFLVTNAIYHQWWAWAILIGSAIFDGLLYLLVRDAVVCYR